MNELFHYKFILSGEKIDKAVAIETEISIPKILQIKGNVEVVENDFSNRYCIMNVHQIFVMLTLQPILQV